MPYLSGVVNNDLLHHLAAELGDEWHQLAESLDVKRGRLAAILRNNVNHPAEAVYEMLVTWAKQVPLATSTVSKGADDIVSIMVSFCHHHIHYHHHWAAVMCRVCVDKGLNIPSTS